jgi:hypothetical protein
MRESDSRVGAAVLVAVGVLVGALVSHAAHVAWVAAIVSILVAVLGSARLVLEHPRRLRARSAEAEGEAVDLDRASGTPRRPTPVQTSEGTPSDRVAVLDYALADPASAARAQRQAMVLAPYIGRWVAVGEPTEVLLAADSRGELIALLEERHVDARGGIFLVPTDIRASEGVAPE